jgi:hypothetical protein
LHTFNECIFIIDSLITCSQRRRQRRRPLLHWKLLPQPQRPQLPKVIRPMTRKIHTEKN